MAEMVTGGNEQPIIDKDKLAERVAELKNEAAQKASNTFDQRARLQLYRNNSKDFFNDADNVLTPLQKNRGIVFPYTPNIYITRGANYGSMEFKGSNFPVYSYINSAPPTIPLIATFTAGTKEDGQYMLAVYRFLNILTQADFGEKAVKSGKNGAPPPVLQFSYLGPFGFDRVPVILTDFNMLIGNNVDMVPIEHPQTGTDGNTKEFASAFGDNANMTYMPVDVEFTINLQVQYSPRRVRKDFDLDAMRKGHNIGFI
jgi:hypothetical protein